MVGILRNNLPTRVYRPNSMHVILVVITLLSIIQAKGIALHSLLPEPKPLDCASFEKRVTKGEVLTMAELRKALFVMCSLEDSECILRLLTEEEKIDSDGIVEQFIDHCGALPFHQRFHFCPFIVKLLDNGIAVSTDDLNHLIRGDGFSETAASDLMEHGIAPDLYTFELACWKSVRLACQASASIDLKTADPEAVVKLFSNPLNFLTFGSELYEIFLRLLKCGFSMEFVHFGELNLLEHLLDKGVISNHLYSSAKPFMTDVMKIIRDLVILGFEYKDQIKEGLMKVDPELHAGLNMYRDYKEKFTIVRRGLQSSPMFEGVPEDIFQVMASMLMLI